MGRSGARGTAVRHGHCVAQCRTAEEAARLIQLLASDGPNASVLDGFEQGLGGAGLKLGVGRKATSEEVRRALAKAQPELARRWVAMRGGRRWAAHPDRDLLEEVMEALDAHSGTIGSEQDEASQRKVKEKSTTTALLAEKVLELQAADQRFQQLLADASEEQRALELKVQETEDEAVQLTHRSHEQSQKISELEQAMAELQERRGPAVPLLTSGCDVETEELEVGFGEGQQNTAEQEQCNGNAQEANGDQKSTKQNHGRHLNLVKAEERNSTELAAVGSELDDQGGMQRTSAEEVITQGSKGSSADKPVQGAVGNQLSTEGNQGSHLPSVPMAGGGIQVYGWQNRNYRHHGYKYNQNLWLVGSDGSWVPPQFEGTWTCSQCHVRETKRAGRTASTAARLMINSVLACLLALVSLHPLSLVPMAQMEQAAKLMDKSGNVGLAAEYRRFIAQQAALASVLGEPEPAESNYTQAVSEMHAQVRAPDEPRPATCNGITIDDIMDGTLDKLEKSCHSLFGLSEYHNLSKEEIEEVGERAKALSAGLKEIGTQLSGAIRDNRGDGVFCRRPTGILCLGVGSWPPRVQEHHLVSQDAINAGVRWAKGSRTICCCSMCLHHSQSLSYSSVDIIGRAASFIESACQPTVVGADFNVSRHFEEVRRDGWRHSLKLAVLCQSPMACSDAPQLLDAFQPLEPLPNLSAEELRCTSRTYALGDNHSTLTDIDFQDPAERLLFTRGRFEHPGDTLHRPLTEGGFEVVGINGFR
ncbi:unnamed protein product, partial [Prorocentrum cordatum]